MTMVPTVPLVFLVSVAASKMHFGDSSPGSASLSLLTVTVSVRCFGDSSAYSASGVLGVSSCI